MDEWIRSSIEVSVEVWKLCTCRCWSRVKIHGYSKSVENLFFLVFTSVNLQWKFWCWAWVCCWLVWLVVGKKIATSHSGRARKRWHHFICLSTLLINDTLITLRDAVSFSPSRYCTTSLVITSKLESYEIGVCRNQADDAATNVFIHNMFIPN